MVVFLVDEASYGIALSYSSPDTKIVLLQDAVYHVTKGPQRGELYVLDDDVVRRGLDSKIPPAVHVIGYGDLVRMMEQEMVVNFQ